ncbi:MAG: nitric oxide reductase activation protein [Methylococcales bacterium]|jgi:nitric oxide reductase NorD protein|nr:nitric oxide reductase activation protein [Methylococcales bacterium]MBT7444719.1 nitric oxide reductase activation protein [Methylococcales bacterium]
MEALDAQSIEALFEPWFISYQELEAPSVAVSKLNRQQQDFALRWVEVLSGMNDELAYQCLLNIPTAFARMPEETIEQWIVQAMDLYDRKGLMGSVRHLVDIDNFIALYEKRLYSLYLDEVTEVLSRFIHGLSGRSLKLAQSDQGIFTDTETLFLPEILHELPERQDNFILYKAMLVHQWAQLWFGTWRVDIASITNAYPEPKKALLLFHYLELTRLDARTAHELPGLYREMVRLKKHFKEDCTLETSHREKLTALSATVQDSVAVLAECYGKTEPIQCCYQGVLNTDAVRETQTLRLEKEKRIFRMGLFDELSEIEETPERLNERFSAQKIEDSEAPDGFTMMLELDGKPMPLPESMKTTLNSIVQDLGDIPPEYLEAAGPGAYPAELLEKEDPANVWTGTYHEEGAFIYNEWDFQRRHYKKNWCALRELEVTPVYDDFVQKTLNKHHGLIISLRKTFEALRGEDKNLKRQPDGETIDIDALVEAYADKELGMEMTQNLFVRRHKVDRNIAVLFMVDMSGSTKGWINDAERESLILLCEALESLGDRYAIYGFSGNTRKRCEIYKIKSFSERYDNDVKAKISGIKAQDYTRMGVAIRHFSKLLLEVDAKVRMLVTLSDGKPDDYDNYRGQYGIEDTRQALVEARRNHIHSFCITIDETANDYLPHMYGAANYIVIDDVPKLPLKVSDIYRKLTT